LPIFPNNNAGSLFDLVQETQSEQFSSIRWVFGRPVLSSSFTSSRPSLNLLCHSKTLDFFIASAPQASVNICRVSLALFPNFAQNLMLMRCSNNHHSFFRRDENTRLCNTATASLLLSYLLHQHTRRNHRHVVTCRLLVLLTRSSIRRICGHSGNLIVTSRISRSLPSSFVFSANPVLPKSTMPYQYKWRVKPQSPALTAYQESNPREYGATPVASKKHGVWDLKRADLLSLFQYDYRIPHSRNDSVLFSSTINPLESNSNYMYQLV
jgi:hypothetical protein